MCCSNIKVLMNHLEFTVGNSAYLASSWVMGKLLVHRSLFKKEDSKLSSLSQSLQSKFLAMKVKTMELMEAL